MVLPLPTAASSSFSRAGLGAGGILRSAAISGGNDAPSTSVPAHQAVRVGDAAPPMGEALGRGGTHPQPNVAPDRTDLSSAAFHLPAPQSMPPSATSTVDDAHRASTSHDHASAIACPLPHPSLDASASAFPSSAPHPPSGQHPQHPPEAPETTAADADLTSGPRGDCPRGTADTPLEAAREDGSGTSASNGHPHAHPSAEAASGLFAKSLGGETGGTDGTLSIAKTSKGATSNGGLLGMDAYT